MTSSTIALILLTQTVATPVPPVPRAAAVTVAQATATIVEAREITFAEAPPPRRSRLTGELRRLIEFE